MGLLFCVINLQQCAKTATLAQQPSCSWLQVTKPKWKGGKLCMSRRVMSLTQNAIGKCWL